MEKCIWKQCGGQLVDYGNGLGLHCKSCTRDLNIEYWEGIERAKAKQEGNPKTYGTAYGGSYGYKHNIELEGYVISLLSKMCRG
jgi:hypothetical protein